MATCIAALLCTGAPWHRLCCGCFLPILQTAAAIYCRLSLLFLPAVSDFYSISCANNYGVYLLPLLPCTDAVLLYLLVWTAAMLLMSSSCMQHATAICWVLRLILQLLSSECAWATSAAQEPLSFSLNWQGWNYLKLIVVWCKSFVIIKYNAENAWARYTEYWIFLLWFDALYVFVDMPLRQLLSPFLSPCADFIHSYMIGWCCTDLANVARPKTKIDVLVSFDALAYNIILKKTLNWSHVIFSWNLGIWFCLWVIEVYVIYTCTIFNIKGKD